LATKNILNGYTRKYIKMGGEKQSVWNRENGADKPKDLFEIHATTHWVHKAIKSTTNHQHRTLAHTYTWRFS